MNGLLYRINKRATYYLLRNVQIISPRRKIVTFTFDDAPLSAFKNGGDILIKHEKKGTFYLSLSFLKGQTNSNWYFNIDDLRTCISQGHELGCHTYDHLYFKQVNDYNQILEDALKNQTVLEESGLGVKFENFAYPFGAQTYNAKKVVSGFYNTCRGIYYGKNLSKGVNVGKADLNNLLAINLYEEFNKLSNIYSLLEEFSNNGGWLIFYTHDVNEDYSQYGCSPDFFESVLIKCIDLGLEVKNTKEALIELKKDWLQ